MCALVDYGFRVVIAPSFSDIFYNNCLRNGVLPVRLDADVVAGIRARLATDPGRHLLVDLPNQMVTEFHGTRHRFDVDPAWKEALVEGLDEIRRTLAMEDRIAAFERRYHAEHPWLP